MDEIGLESGSSRPRRSASVDVSLDQLNAIFGASSNGTRGAKQQKTCSTSCRQEDLPAQAARLALLALYTVVSFALALRWFRWV